MSFTKSTTDISVHQKLGDYPSQDNGITADELKKKFDYPAETLQKDLNKIVEELSEIMASSNIGADKIHESDDSAGNVQAKLKKIYKDLQNVTLGQIPDGSVTENKLDGSYASMLAKKDGSLQKDLNAEKIGGFTLSEIFKIGSYTGNRTNTGSEEQIIELGFKPRFLVIICEITAALLIDNIGIILKGGTSANDALTTKDIEILDIGFKVLGNELNRISRKYTYIAFR